jgi:hypothetical protein
VSARRLGLAFVACASISAAACDDEIVAVDFDAAPAELDAARDASADAAVARLDADAMRAPPMLGDGADVPDIDRPPLAPLDGHALLGGSDGVSATQVIDWEAGTLNVYQTVAFDHKDIVIYGRRGIVRFLDPEDGLVIVPDEGYNYVHPRKEVDVNPSAVPLAGTDASAAPADAGTPAPYSTIPVASIPGPTGVDFVLSRERNDIVLVQTSTDDIGVAGTIDLSEFRDPTDHDGKIDPVDGLYDPLSGLMLALLARIDRTASKWPTDLPSCDGPAPLLAAIHPVLRTVVDLTPALGTRAIPLLGRAPAGIEQDPDGEDIYVLSAGCIGEGGAVQGRGIEVINLDTRKHDWVLDLNAMPRPTKILPVGLDFVLVQFDKRLFRWNTALDMLDMPEITHAPYPIASMGRGWVVGFDASENLVLVDAFYDDSYPMDRKPITLPGAHPTGQAYGWL